MNKHGQSLITFVLILPLIVFFLAFLIDSIVGIMNKKRIEGIIVSNLKVVVDKDIRDTEKIEKAIKENDKDLDVHLNIIDDTLIINVLGKKKNIFGNILKMKWTDLEFNYCAYYRNKKIKKDCVG